MFRSCNWQTLSMKSLPDACLNANDLQWEISHSVPYCPWLCKHVVPLNCYFKHQCDGIKTLCYSITMIQMIMTQYITLSPSNPPWVLHTSSPFESPLPTFFSFLLLLLLWTHSSLTLLFVEVCGWPPPPHPEPPHTVSLSNIHRLSFFCED